MTEDAEKRLLADLKSFLKDDQYLDLDIVCDGDIFHVHKIIMCMRSSFFATATKFPGKESVERKINLPDDDPAIINLMINYIYTADYEPSLPQQMEEKLTAREAAPKHSCSVQWSVTYGYAHSGQSCGTQLCSHHDCGEQCGNGSPACSDFVCNTCFPLPKTIGTSEQLLTHAKMYEIADKYDISGLKDLSKLKFKHACTSFWDSPPFTQAANYAFTTTPEEDKGLRDIICSTISDHMILLKKPEIEALMMEFNGMAFGLLKKKAEEHGWVK